ncbi:hypothetical protein GCM10011508_02500 [Flavobacterium lutivivi]|nr:hypothetical protein GCM10011508_02500 [Flavobacterium lutivivi]
MKKITFYLKKSYFLFTFFLLVFISNPLQSQTVRTYTTSGSFVVPAGVSSVKVEAWGGGGAGGGVNGSNSQTRTGGGGAGGAYVVNNSVSVTPGATITVTVGAGGNGVSAGDGNPGGNSIFASTTPVTANGGLGGILGDGSPQHGSGAAVNTGTRNGGSGGTGSNSVSGAGGGGAGNTGSGSNASGGTSGNGGTGDSGSTSGGNGASGITSTGNGNSATTLSGGGSGGRSTSNTNRTGGSGFRGQVLVTYTCPNYALLSTTASDFCSTTGTSVNVSLNASATNLPIGTYTVTYNRTNPSGTALTATMTVTTAGTGTFTATGLTNTGTSTITITNLASSYCSNAILSNNSVVVDRVAGPTAVAGTSIVQCYSSGAINVTSGSSATNYSSVQWTSSGTGTFSNADSLTSCTYTPSIADLNSGVVTLTLTANSTAPCTNATSTKTLSFFSLPVTTGASICQGASGTLISTINENRLTIPGSWATSPIANRPNTSTNSTTCGFSTTVTRNYTATRFKVSQTGSYVFLMDNNTAFDGMGYIVTGSFIPGSCGSGTYVRGDDDSSPVDDEPQITVTLTAGITYTLVSTTYATSTGIYTGNYNWTITPPSGGSILPVTEWYTAPSGGVFLGTGSPFNPVGVSGSGLPNTNSAGVTTFYASNSLNPSCGRVPVDFEIKTNVTYYADVDGDGFGNPLSSVVSCDGNPNPSLYVTNNLDCNDTIIYYEDNDGDGFGSSQMVACGTVTNNLDCNDIVVYYQDNDGDGFGSNMKLPCGVITNNSDCNDNQLQYQDLDGDGFGSNVTVACGVANNLDCDDNQLQYVDNDGDGYGSLTLVACGVINNTDCDDNDNTKHTTFSFYEDVDGDGVGFGALVSGVCAVDANTPPVGYSLTNTDCAPSDGLAYQMGMFYTDADGDNYSLDNSQVSLCYGATEPEGYSAVSLGIDCNDSVAAINPGMTEILYDGFDNNCNGLLDEGNQLIVNMSSCGTTLATISSLISCVNAPGIHGYRFEITNTLTNNVQVIDRPHQYFSLTQLTSFEYATTYSVRVMLRKNGIWLGYYGPSCLYSTPPVTQPTGGTGTTQLQTYCGQTLPSISTIIATTSLPGATGYRFRVTNTTTGSIQTLTRTLHWFSLTMLPSYNYGTTYVVDVAVKTTGDYSEYGAPCNVTTPNVPTLVNYCGGAIVPTKGTNIYTSSLDRVTSYRFEVTRYTDETLSTAVDVSQIDRNINWFTFNMVSNYSANTHYGVRVQVMTSGTWSPWSDACEIVSPATARVTESTTSEVFSVKGYPNPYDYEFSLQMESSSDARVSIKVYDMVGKLIDTREVQPMDVPTVSIGSRYPSGVYNVVVSQGEHTQTLRMVKR